MFYRRSRFIAHSVSPASPITSPGRLQIIDSSAVVDSQGLNRLLAHMEDTRTVNQTMNLNVTSTPGVVPYMPDVPRYATSYRYCSYLVLYRVYFPIIILLLFGFPGKHQLRKFEKEMIGY